MNLILLNYENNLTLIQPLTSSSANSHPIIELQNDPIESNILYKSIVYSLTIPLFILTAAGNGIILITIKFQARLLSSNSNYFILSLACADFFVGVVIMPIMILFTANHQKWIYGQALCDFWMSFDFLCSSASFLTLSAMSIERYKMLTTSYVHIKNSSKLRIIIFVCLSWLLPFFTWTPVIITFRLLNGADAPNDCSMPANNFLVLALCVSLYHIPLVCMVTFYTKLIIHIRHSSMHQIDSANSFNCSFSSYNYSFTRTNPRLPNINFAASRTLKKQAFSQTNNNFLFYYNSNNNLNLIENNLYEKAGDEKKVTTKASTMTNENGYCFCSSSALSPAFDNEPITLNTLACKLAFVLPCCFNGSNNLKPSRSANSSMTLKALSKNPQFRNNFIIKCMPDNSSANLSDTLTNFAKAQEKKNRKKSFGKVSAKNNLVLMVHKSIEHESRSQRSFKLENNEVNENDELMGQKAENAEPIQGLRFKRFRSMNSMPFIDSVSNCNNNNNQNNPSNNLESNNNNNNSNNQGEVIFTLPDDCVEKVNRANQAITNSLKKKETIFEQSGYQNLRQKRNRKAARMLGLLVATFSVCWLPYTIFYPICQFYPDLVPSYATIVIWWMGYLNSTINPFLYVYSNKNIRRSVRNLFCKRIFNSLTGQRQSRIFRHNSLKNNQENGVNVYANLMDFGAGAGFGGSYRNPNLNKIRFRNI